MSTFLGSLTINQSSWASLFFNYQLFNQPTECLRQVFLYFGNTQINVRPIWACNNQVQVVLQIHTTTTLVNIPFRNNMGFIGNNHKQVTLIDGRLKHLPLFFVQNKCLRVCKDERVFPSKCAILVGIISG